MFDYNLVIALFILNVVLIMYALLVGVKDIFINSVEMLSKSLYSALYNVLTINTIDEYKLIIKPLFPVVDDKERTFVIQFDNKHNNVLSGSVPIGKKIIDSIYKSTNKLPSGYKYQILVNGNTINEDTIIPDTYYHKYAIPRKTIYIYIIGLVSIIIGVVINNML